MNTPVLFICPLCRAELSTRENSLVCCNSHSYDLSRSGYCNLLLANMKNKLLPGDSAEMVNARNRFFNCGYYSRLSEHLIDDILTTVKDCVLTNPVIFDAGCGVGYFISRIKLSMSAHTETACCGIDISKAAIACAAKNNPAISFAVAGLFAMPLPDCSINVLLNIFAPSPVKEFYRILAANGTLYHVYPGSEHLLSLRQELFESVRPMRQRNDFDSLLVKESSTELKYDFIIKSGSAISDLIAMTPYNWIKDRARAKDFITRVADENNSFKTTAHFIITKYKKPN